MRQRILIIGLLVTWQITCQAVAADLKRAQQLFFSGDFDSCLEQIEAAMADGEVAEDWYLLMMDAQMAMGDYGAATKTLDAGLDENSNSIRLRWKGRDACRYDDRPMREKELLIELEDMINFRSWRYRSAANQIVIAQFMLESGVDAKKVLDEVLLKAIGKEPAFVDAYLAVGDLAMTKHDYALAADNYRKATGLDANNPRGFMGLAVAFRPSDIDRSNQALQQALKIDPNHVAANLFVINDRIDAEHYEEAESFIKKILEINPHDPTALAYRAVVAQLMNKPEDADTYRKQALSHWQSNPQVDHLIGKKLSQKYRFAEGARFQRRALIFEAEYLPAKMQLANDLLRLGDERQGWELVESVYDKDGYNVVAHNLVTLGNHMRSFATLEKEGFIVRMDPFEARVYGSSVLKLLVEAKQALCTKYESDIELPIIVEIFPEQQDFAIRTFGLPGGAGFLGVCFGRVITMNSPSTQSVDSNNWQSVLWHEFCHVVTLQKTDNKMPRWLSEGISVYEESQKDPAWGQTMTPRFREMVLGDDLTPVSQLSGAFLDPKSPEHLQFAYYESSLAVEYIIEQYGLDVLKRMLDDLAIGMSINQVLDRYTGSIKLLDKEFSEFARQRARETAPRADWTKPSVRPQSDVETWRQWVEKNPNNFRGLLSYAVQLIKAEEWKKALDPLEQLIRLYPDYRGANNPYILLARVMRELGNEQRELELLEKAASLQSGALPVYRRLHEIYFEKQDWEKAALSAHRMLAVNPLVPEPHRRLARTSEKSEDYQNAVVALRTLLELDPLDPADIHYRLAVALHRTGDLQSAKRQVLQCLEEAPRYLEAHRLLLTIIESGESDDASGERTSETETGQSKDENPDKDDQSEDHAR